ncbi:MAG: MATE family efflux transporter, partial [Clostridia bacterium]
AALANYDVELIKAKTSLSLKFSLLLSAPCFFGFFALAKPILQMLYPTISATQLDLASQLLRVASINVILLSTLEILSAMLQGLDRSKKVLVNVAIGGGAKL